MDSDELSEPEQAEGAQAAIREGIERARELVCEAKLAMRQSESPNPEPINPAT